MSASSRIGFRLNEPKTELCKHANDQSSPTDDIPPVPKSGDGDDVRSDECGHPDTTESELPQIAGGAEQPYSAGQETEDEGDRGIEVIRMESIALQSINAIGKPIAHHRRRRLAIPPLLWRVLELVH